ncbi:MAG: radical SAM protein [Pseudomonadota bacterium]
MILINPPVVKPCEPPPGVARLAGALKRHNISHHIIDANLEGLLNLLKAPIRMEDRWTSRAVRNLNSHLSTLRSFKGFENMDRYARAVIDVNRVLEKSVPFHGVHITLTNYQDQTLSPVRSQDLIRATEVPEMNPFFPYLRKRLLTVLEHKTPGVVGFSLNYLGQALCTFMMIGMIKKECPGTKVVLGGGLITSWMNRPGWVNPFEGLVDAMVSGPGEDALLSICGLQGCDGDCTPEYEAFSKIDYLAPGFILPYSASMGCYWHQCSFCPETAEGNPYGPVPPEKVIRDMTALTRDNKPCLVHFLDNAMSPALLQKMIERPLNIPWYGFARITPHLADPDFCMGLKRSGCVMLQLGLESGDQDVLSELRKGIDLEQASLALKNLKRAGIATYVYLLLGTPAETLSRARKTLEFTVQHGHVIDFLNLAIFNMPANGPDAEKFESADFYEGDLRLYKSFVHPKGWDRGSVRRFLDKEFKRHPVVAAILRRSPPLFSSNHAPFFSMASRAKG